MRRAKGVAPSESSHGDVDFDDLFRSTFPRALTTARRIVGPAGDPEGLAAEALTRAYDRWPSLRRHPSPEAWVLRVTINLSLDRMRRPNPAMGGTLDIRDHVVAEADPDLERLEHLDDATATRLALGAALRSLPEKQRHAVALRYLAGCAEEDIAASLGINPGTVKTHLKRGLAGLRMQLAHDPEIPHALVP